MKRWLVMLLFIGPIFLLLQGQVLARSQPILRHTSQPKLWSSVESKHSIVFTLHDPALEMGFKDIAKAAGSAPIPLSPHLASVPFVRSHQAVLAYVNQGKHKVLLLHLTRNKKRWWVQKEYGLALHTGRVLKVTATTVTLWRHGTQVSYPLQAMAPLYRAHDMGIPALSWGNLPRGDLLRFALYKGQLVVGMSSPLSMTGTVKAIYGRRLEIQFDGPVYGIHTVLLLANAHVFAQGSNKKSLIRPGMRVSVSGRSSGSTLRASWVWVLRNQSVSV